MNGLENIQPPPGLLQNQKNSTAIRIWHWLTFAGFLASMITVLLGSTFFKTKDNISPIMVRVAREGGLVTKDQARAIAHDYSDKLWNGHKIIGFVLCFLFVSRVLIEIYQKKNDTLQNRIRSALNLTPSNEKAIRDRNFYLLVKRGYFLFYIIFLTMAMTGLVMAFDDIALLKPLQKTADSIHLFVQWLIYGFIILHIAGVVYSDLHNNKGIVSGMINGGEH